MCGAHPRTHTDGWQIKGETNIKFATSLDLSWLFFPTGLWISTGGWISILLKHIPSLGVLMIVVDSKISQVFWAEMWWLLDPQHMIHMIFLLIKPFSDPLTSWKRPLTTIFMHPWTAIFAFLFLSWGLSLSVYFHLLAMDCSCWSHPALTFSVTWGRVALLFLMHEHHRHQMWAVDHVFWHWCLSHRPKCKSDCGHWFYKISRQLSVNCSSCHLCLYNESSFKVTLIFSSCHHNQNQLDMLSILMPQSMTEC